MAKFVITLSAALFFIAAVPLRASGGGTVPEPSDLALFALGLIGVVVGRKAAMRRSKPDGENE